MNDKSNIELNFRLLINTLLTLSLPTSQQILKLGKHGVPLHFSVDMDCHYEEYRERYIQNGILFEQEIDILDRLYNYMSSIYGEYDEKFWMDIIQLKAHEYWSKLRVLAKESLEILKSKYDDLIQEIIRNPLEYE